MAVCEVKKINIVATKDYKEQVMDLLYDGGLVEISDVKEKVVDVCGTASASGVSKVNVEFALAQTRRALDILTPFSHEKKTLLEKINPQKIKISQSEISKLSENFDYAGVSEKAEELGQELNSLNSLIDKLNGEVLGLEVWKGTGLTASLDKGFETKYTKTLFGEINEKKYGDFWGELSARFKNTHVKKINGQNEIARAVIVYDKSIEGELMPYLALREFKTADMPDIESSVEEKLKQMENELSDARKRLGELKKEAGEMAEDHILDLQIIHDFLLWEFGKEEASKNILNTRNSFSVIGWARKRDIEKIKRNINEITDEADVIVVEPDEGESTPVAMENIGFFKPFEFVTNLYGQPKYTEVDPTPFLAGFFVLFFGLCLSDAGYGIVLSVVSYLALKFLKFDEGFKKLLKILFWGGIATFFVGALTGGWFGIVLDDMPVSFGWLSKVLIFMRQLDPVQDPITLLVISLALGYVHLIFGNAINLWWSVKNKETKKGILGPGVWIYFLLAVGFWIVSSYVLSSVVLKQVSPYIVYSSLLLIILTQGQGKGVSKILGGLAQLYFGLTGYLSDILSYSRLLALGLATAIIGMVVNIVGAMANGLIPYVGWILMIVVLVLGHIFNLVISLVGSFIHSGRLQYVEFFKTFFEGGGRKFTPFMRESRYLELVKVENAQEDKK